MDNRSNFSNSSRFGNICKIVLDRDSFVEEINRSVTPVFNALNIPCTKGNLIKYCFLGGIRALKQDYPNAKYILSKNPHFPKFMALGRERNFVDELDENIQKRCFEVSSENCQNSFDVDEESVILR